MNDPYERMLEGYSFTGVVHPPEIVEAVNNSFVSIDLKTYQDHFKTGVVHCEDGDYRVSIYTGFTVHLEGLPLPVWIEKELRRHITHETEDATYARTVSRTAAGLTRELRDRNAENSHLRRVLRDERRLSKAALALYIDKSDRMQIYATCLGITAGLSILLHLYNWFWG